MANNGRPPLSLILFAFLAASAFIGTLRAQQTTPAQPADKAAPPQSQPAPPAKQPEAGKPVPPVGEGVPALVVDGDQMMGILGKQVRSSAGEDMGRIVDVIVDKSARVRGAVIDFGGFLGVGNRQIAVAWNAIRPPGQDKPGALVVDFTRDQLRVAPAYKAGEQVVLLGAADPPATSGSSAAGTKDAKDSKSNKETSKEQPSK